MMKTTMAWLTAAVLLISTAATNGQIQVHQGNVLDANMRVGSGGLNAPVRRPDYGMSNRIVTGNVTGGQSFRGFTPLRDPSSLMLPSNTAGVSPNGTFSYTGSGSFGRSFSTGPADTLGGFTRDSFSIADLRRGERYRGYPQPYYSREGTILNTGAIAAGLNRPGTSQARSPYALPRANLINRPGDPLDDSRIDLRGSTSQLSSRLVRVNTGELVPGEVNPRLASSPLFGGVRAVPMDALATSAMQGRGEANQGMIDQQRDTLMAASPLEEALANRRQFDRTQPVSEWSKAQDVFTQMRALFTIDGEAPPVEPDAAAPATEERPSAPIGESPRPKPVTEPVLAPALAEQPLRSFVGTTESKFNKYMLEAETYLKSGDYYRAASRYHFARMMDPENPLPLVGRSMSLLAAGDYMSSANSLFSAIREFDQLGEFHIDFTSFIPDLSVLDRRRIDLEERLERREDYRLRFLLGYAEICSGLEEAGLQHLDEAAQQAPEGLEGVREFVKDLHNRALMPPAK